MAKRKSKRKSTPKADPLKTPVHWKKGQTVKRAAIAKLFPKDMMVKPLWGGREGQLKNLLGDAEYEVFIARENKAGNWWSYSLRSDNIIFGFSEGTLDNFHRFMKPLVRIKDIPKGDKGRVKTKKKKKSKAKAKKTSRPE